MAAIGVAVTGNAMTVHTSNLKHGAWRVGAGVTTFGRNAKSSFASSAAATITSTYVAAAGRRSMGISMPSSAAKSLDVAVGS